MLQYACLENTLPDRETWQATVYRVAKSQTLLHYWESQFLGRLIRSLGSSRREGSGALEEEIGVWNSRGGNDKLFFSSTFLSLSHIKHFFFKPGTDNYISVKKSTKRQYWRNNNKLLKKKEEEPRDLPGASMAKTPHFQCRGLGFDPCVKAHMLQRKVCVPQIKIQHAAIKDPACPNSDPAPPNK